MVKKFFSNLGTNAHVKKFSNSRVQNPRRVQVVREVASKLLDLVGDEYLEGKYIGSRDTRCQDIANQVTEKGFVVIPNVFSGDTIQQFREEFDTIISESGTNNYPVDKHNGAICVRITPRQGLDVERFPITSAFFDLEIVRQIAESFYAVGPKELSVNSEIFVHQTLETNEPK